MNKELIKKSLAYVNATRNHPLSSGMNLDYETIHALAIKIPQKRDIRLLFASNGGMPASYLCGIKCDVCEMQYQSVLTKTSLIEYINQIQRQSNGLQMFSFNFMPTCVECKKIKDEKNAASIKLYDEEFRRRHNEEKNYYTNYLITNFLSPNAVPKSEYTWKDLSINMNRCLINCDDEKISKAILDLEYRDFLATPYWRIISYEIKRRNKFKCLMCDSKENLNVHHKNYDYHGFEHTIDGIKSLVCVCKSCHSKHHGHYE